MNFLQLSQVANILDVSHDSPADVFRLKVARVTSINDYDLMVLVQKTLNSGFWCSCYVTPEASTVAGPPEGVTLTVLLSEHQQDLKKNNDKETWIKQLSQRFKITQMLQSHDFMAQKEKKILSTFNHKQRLSSFSQGLYSLLDQDQDQFS